MPQATVSTPQTASPTTQVPLFRTAPTATEMYEAARLARRELRGQQDQLQSERRQVQSQLAGASNPTDINGLEGRLVVIDARITDVEKQLSSADALVANRAAVPGVVVAPSGGGPNPQEMAAMGMAFSLVLLMPVSIAFARRIWRRGAAPAPALPSDLADRMANIERGIEAVAIEVERVGEGQRFVTQLLAESDRTRPMHLLPSEPGKGGREL